jgi:hypothetical protein
LELEKEIEETKSENARMVLQEQKEIIGLNAKMQNAIIEAEEKSFEHSAHILKEMMKSINTISQQRLELIENGQLEIVKKIENMYSDFEKEINNDNMNFQLNQLPQMLETLEKFPPESSSHQLYSQSVEKQMNLNFEFVSRKLADLGKRQQTLIDSSVKTKDLIVEHSNRVVEERMKFLENQLESRKELARQNNLQVGNTKLLEK